MADHQWLFPERALPLVDLHDRFFAKMNPPARSLSQRELAQYGNGPYLSGWRFDIGTSNGAMELNVLLNAKTPFSVPRIALVDSRFFMKWPHVEENGLLCLRQDTDAIDHTSGINLTQYYIKQAVSLIEDSITGKTQIDFITEFNSYWNRWCTRKNYSRDTVLMLAAPDAPSRLVYRGLFGSNIVICDTPEEGLRWARDRFQDGSIKTDRFQPAAFIWLDAPIRPEEYPKCNANVAALAKKAGSNVFDMLLPLVPDSTGNMLVVFGFDSGNGPAFGALRLNDVPKNVRAKKKNDSRRYNGFRNRPANRKVLREKFFNATAKTEALPVQRIDRTWIFDRGSRGFDKRLDEARACLIGCGSLGARVAHLLAQSGVRNFVLIDPERLSWDNIGRHLLGGKDTGQLKINGVKQHLENHFPGMLEIQTEPTEWQTVFSDGTRKKLVTRSDIVVSTIGNWDAEAALNHAFNTTSEFPPVIYGWTEPYGVAGHALAITNLGGCLTCGMDSHGGFINAITKWEKRSYLKRPPACGETYQPYGTIDIAPTQAMIARLCSDVITGKVIRSQHRSWLGDLSQVEEAGGRLTEGLEDYYGDIGQGHRQITKDWKINRKCMMRH